MSCQADWFVSQMSAAVFPTPPHFPLLFKEQDIDPNAMYRKRVPRLHHLCESSKGIVVFLSIHSFFLAWPLSWWLWFLSWFCIISSHLSIQNDFKIRLLQEA